MDQFSHWSGLAHARLRNHVRSIKLGQVHQILAACVGHRTYASLRESDLETLNQHPRYVLFDVEAGLERAADLGIPLSREQWKEATMLLRPSGITPFWLTNMREMNEAARLVFEDSGDERIHALQRAVGMPNGRWSTSSRCHHGGDDVPQVLRFDVEGEVHAFNEHVSLAIPVIALVEFPRIGRRMYGEGTLTSVERNGEPWERDPDEDDGGEVY